MLVRNVKVFRFHWNKESVLPTSIMCNLKSSTDFFPMPEANKTCKLLGYKNKNVLRRHIWGVPVPWNQEKPEISVGKLSKRSGPTGILLEEKVPSFAELDRFAGTGSSCVTKTYHSVITNQFLFLQHAVDQAAWSRITQSRGVQGLTAHERNHSFTIQHGQSQHQIPQANVLVLFSFVFLFDHKWQ